MRRIIAVVLALVLVIVALFAGLIVGLGMGSRGQATQFLNSIGIHAGAPNGRGGNAGGSTSVLAELNLTGVTSTVSRILGGIGLNARVTANTNRRSGPLVNATVNGSNSGLLGLKGLNVNVNP